MTPVGMRLAKRVPFYYGWVVAGAVALIIMTAMTLTVTTMSAFVEPLSREFGWSRGAISGAISFGTLGAAAAGPLLGRWVDRYGARMLLTVGSLVMAASLFGLAMMQNLLMFYVVFVLGRTVMMNIEHLIGPTAAANWFIRRRATATALVLGSSRVGLGVWPAMAGLVFVVADWRTAFWIMGIIVGVAAIVPLVFIVGRRPEDVGLLPDGDTRRASDEAAASVRLEEPAWTAREALRTQAFWLIMGVNSIALFIGSGVGLHRIPYFVDKGLNEALVGPILIAFSIGMAAGGFVAARLMRWFAETTVTAMLMVLGAGLMVLLLATPGNALAIGYGLLDGVIFGGLLTSQPVIYANFYGRMSVGTIRGLAHPALMVGNAGGALFGGVVYDLSGQTYTWVFVTFIGLLLIGAVSAKLARKPQRR